jgi:signal peptidase I
MADEAFKPADPFPPFERGADPSTDGVRAGKPIPPVAPPSPRPAAKPEARAPHEPRDNLREIVETVVFVIVLVLILKTFVAEAFVIPTGSMGTTLLGYQRQVTCPKCGWVFPVNYSSEADPQERRPTPIEKCRCENCEYEVELYKAPGRTFP